MGSTGQLLRAQVLSAVRPLESEAEFANANPVGVDGSVSFDDAAMEAREDAHVREALAHGPCVVIVLGGAHDLSDNIGRIAPGTCEYLRVATRWQRQLANEEE